MSNDFLFTREAICIILYIQDGTPRVILLAIHEYARCDCPAERVYANNLIHCLYLWYLLVIDIGQL